MHTACNDELASELDDSEFECPECKELSGKQFASIKKNEPAISLGEPTIEDTRTKMSEPVIAICETTPICNPASNRTIESKNSEIELIELSSDEEDEDGLICMQFASSSLGNPINRSRNNGHLNKISNQSNCQFS